MNPELMRRAEMVVQAMLGQDPTPAGIVQTLVAANLISSGRNGDNTLAELTVWRAEYDTIPLGTFLDRGDARAACEHQLRALTSHTVLMWTGFTSDDGVLGLWAERADGGHDATGFSVVPVRVQAAYDPQADQ